MCIFIAVLKSPKNVKNKKIWVRSYLRQQLQSPVTKSTFSKKIPLAFKDRTPTLRYCVGNFTVNPVESQRYLFLYNQLRNGIKDLRVVLTVKRGALYSQHLTVKHAQLLDTYKPWLPEIATPTPTEHVSEKPVELLNSFTANLWRKLQTFKQNLTSYLTKQYKAYKIRLRGLFGYKTSEKVKPVSYIKSKRILHFRRNLRDNPQSRNSPLTIKLRNLNKTPLI